jgi:N-acetylglucosamine-6-phosphate deacetylase
MTNWSEIQKGLRVRTKIINGTILTPEQVLPGHELLIENKTVQSIGRTNELPSNSSERVLDAKGMWVIPGFVDIHVHGADGHDTMDATPEALQGMARFFARHGVTSFLPTTVTQSSESILNALRSIGEHSASPSGAQVMGAHLEGPYLNMEHKGAQPPEHIRPPDPNEYRRWFDSRDVRLITLAPEIDGALELIAQGVALGIEFALGHTGSSYEQVLAAANHGVRQATHTFNGMAGLHHRRPGTAGAVLSDDRIYAQVIADGIHLHPATVKILVRSKSIKKTILITDAIRATGLEDGAYELGGHMINVIGGIARTESGSLAGSTLTMDQALRNIMNFTGLSLHEALPMATIVPAEAMGWTGKKGVLAPGADADVVLLDDHQRVQMTMVQGQIVYKNESQLA